MKTQRIITLSAVALALGAAYISVSAQSPARISQGDVANYTIGATFNLASASAADAQQKHIASAPCLIRHQDTTWIVDQRVSRVAMTCGSSAEVSPEYPLLSNSGIQINSAVLTWSSEVQNLPQSRLVSPNESLADCGQQPLFNGVTGGSVDCGRLLNRLEIPPLNGSLQPGTRTYIF